MPISRLKLPIMLFTAVCALGFASVRAATAHGALALRQSEVSVGIKRVAGANMSLTQASVLTLNTSTAQLASHA